jgi:two-component system phosphate regulon sensor histidine kinase PhoR
MKPFTLFYILVLYIFIQFCWWAYLLVDLNQEVYVYKATLSGLQNPALHQEVLMLKKLHHRWFMIAGEGLVFLCLLALGAVKTHKAFTKEVALSNRQKNFLLSVTHELKSPLAAIKLYLQTLQKHDLDKMRQQAFIENALKDTDRLNALVENVLTATKIESHSQIFYKENLNLSETIGVLVNQYLMTSNEQHRFEMEIKPDIFWNFDKQGLSSVLVNLLENAQKYSPKNSLIKISLDSLPSKVLLQVSDEGTGIAENEKLSIFEKFYRVGNEETRQSKGTGLGLFIVRYIVENHQGKIVVKNNHPKGSIFEIVLNG